MLSVCLLATCRFRQRALNGTEIMKNILQLSPSPVKPKFILTPEIKLHENQSATHMCVNQLNHQASFKS